MEAGLSSVVTIGFILALVCLVQSFPADIGKESSPTELTRGFIPNNMTDHVKNNKILAVQYVTAHAPITKGSARGDASLRERHETNKEETEALKSGETVPPPEVDTGGTASKYTMQSVDEHVKQVLLNSKQFEAISKKGIKGNKITVNNMESKRKEGGTLEGRMKQDNGATYTEIVEISPEQSTTTDETVNETTFIINIQDINSKNTKGHISLPYKGTTAAQSVEMKVYATPTEEKEPSGTSSNNNDSYANISQLISDMKSKAIKDKPNAKLHKQNVKFTQFGPFEGRTKVHVSEVDDAEDCLFDHQRFDADALGSTTSPSDTVPEDKTAVEPFEVTTEQSKNNRDKNIFEKSVLESIAVGKDKSLADQYQVHTEKSNPSQIQTGSAERRFMTVILHKVVDNVLQNVLEHDDNTSPDVIRAQSGKLLEDSPTDNAQPEDVDWRLILRSLSHLFQQIATNNVEDLKNQQSGEQEVH